MYKYAQNIYCRQNIDHLEVIPYWKELMPAVSINLKKCHITQGECAHCVALFKQLNWFL